MDSREFQTLPLFQEIINIFQQQQVDVSFIKEFWLPDAEILNLKEFKTLDVLSKLEVRWETIILKLALFWLSTFYFGICFI